MHTLGTIIAVVVFVWFAGGTIYVLFRPRTTTPEDARKDERQVESANAALVHELGNAEGRQLSADALNSAVWSEHDPEPTTTPLSPWLDGTQ